MKTKGQPSMCGGKLDRRGGSIEKERRRKGRTLIRCSTPRELALNASTRSPPPPSPQPSSPRPVSILDHPIPPTSNLDNLDLDSVPLKLEEEANPAAKKGMRGR